MNNNSDTTGDLIEILTSKRDELKPLTRKHGASNIRIFGSYARRKEKSGSDIDLLVGMEEDASLLFHARLKNDLGGLLGKPVDITTRPALHPMFADTILKEAVSI